MNRIDLPRRFGGLIALCLVAATLGGCGTPSQTERGQQSAFNLEFRTIAIPVFANSTPDLKIAPNVTEALIKEIQTFTPWKVTGQGQADTILRGTVTRYRLVLLSKDPTTGLANEMMVEATVNFDWVDLKTGESIVSRSGFAASGGICEPSESTCPVNRIHPRSNARR